MIIPFIVLLVLARCSHGVEDLMHLQKSHCFSCASFVYLPLWQQLMHHYYPPKNFTDRCWQPDAGFHVLRSFSKPHPHLGIGVVPCTSACFTLIERIDDQDYLSEQRGVLRGCVDRLLLFGLDDDVRNVLSGYETQRVCRHTDRKLLRLFPLSAQTDVVTLCTCVGDFCNDRDMLHELNVSSSTQCLTILLLFLVVFHSI